MPYRYSSAQRPAQVPSNGAKRAEVEKDLVHAWALIEVLAESRRHELAAAGPNGARRVRRP